MRLECRKLNRLFGEVLLTSNKPRKAYVVPPRNYFGESFVSLAVNHDDAVSRAAKLLKELREARGISLRQHADHSGVNVSVVSRAERGEDAKLSTWSRLFASLGYRWLWDVTELAEEIPDLLAEEADRRRERRLEGLCTGKRRFY